MKNKIFDSFEAATADIFNGATIAFSTFGTASQAINLWEALYKKDVKDLTVAGNMVMPVKEADEEDILFTAYGPSHCLLQPGKIKKVITGFTSNVYSGSGDDETNPFKEAIEKIEVVPTTFGALCTKLEAAANGYGGILTPVGVGTFLENYYDTYIIDGEKYLLEKPLVPDFGFVKAQKADKLGNLVYRRLQRLHNPLVARASKVTIAEVLEIVEPGEIDPDQIHTPHLYVDRVVKVPEGGKGTPEWDEMMKKRMFGPEGSRRQSKLATSGRGS
jgi:3-oxoadipate CoA-transferase alpha subunit